MKRRQRKTQSLVINRDDGGSFADNKGASHTNYSNITEGEHYLLIVYDVLLLLIIYLQLSHLLFAPRTWFFFYCRYLQS